MAITYLDGQRFRAALCGGTDWVRRQRSHLNRINVFPVADGDTGTNMALSLSATAASIRDSQESHLAQVLRKVSEASILGAKGNSGLILAHWFLGLSRAIGQKSRVTAEELARALRHATETVYHAIENPVEGTILTVMRGASDAAIKAARKGQDVVALLDQVIAGAEAALKRTPEMLEVLKESHVVDAGGQGYLNFLQGMQRAVSGAAVPEMEEEEIHEAAAHTHADRQEIRERFCTELVVRGRGFDGDRLRARFRSQGSCLLIATTGELFKLHIHTNHPDTVFKMAHRLGTIEERKVDDMLQQREERNQPVSDDGVDLAAQPSTVAILCDSTADLPDAVRSEWDVAIVPLQLLFGDRVYRDQVDLGTEEFYEKLKTGKETPTTSQPPPRLFVEAFERIREDRAVIVLTLSASLSGTYRSAMSATKLVRHPRVEIFDSGTASMALGWQVFNAARLAARGADVEKILTWLQRWRESTGIVFALDTLEYLRRGGRIGKAKGLVGSLLGLKPVLTFRDGSVQPVASARSLSDVQQKLVDELERRLPPRTRLRLAMITALDAPDISAVESRLRERFEVVETLHTGITGVVGAHTGPGAWGVAYQAVRDDDPLLH